MTRPRVTGSRSLNQYTLKPEMGIRWRLADYLDWARKNFPYRWLLLPDVAKKVLGLPRRPSEDSDLIDRIKNAKGNAEEIAREHYGVPGGIRISPGQGIRAMVDHNDAAVNYYPFKARRTGGSLRGMSKARKSIDINQVTDAAAKKLLMETDKLLGYTEQGKFLDKLLLPASKESNGKPAESAARKPPKPPKPPKGSQATRRGVSPKPEKPPRRPRSR